MEVKKQQINVIIGPSGSRKKECLFQHLDIKRYDDFYKKKYLPMVVRDVFAQRTTSEKKMIEALKMIGFPATDLDRKIKEFSTGELKKLSIAYTLCENTDTYVFLYPEVGLDARNKNSLMKLFRLFKTRYHKTIIMISNDVDWIHQFADFVFVVYNGNVVTEGTSYEIFCNSKLCRKYKIRIPKIIEFEQTVIRKKKKKIGYRNDVKDLIKDIYRNI